ncbi:putative upf0047 domain protein [Phialemonium atrogriseum]|uniref:Upf0047 domain protein n=1 Tax=Phialemonium atrogriseum TaxID=1093897 RepID=A0AAJ0C5Z0_9PEZI|nr:putative upf0047 domain protein [Phialemonium atrogriseum]KAK1769324.1 putative upf0047 domain protein [Phialemonium atrogriseum]
MPRTTPAVSHTTTILLFLLLLVALFPGAFHLFWSLPLSLFSGLFPHSGPNPPPLPTTTPSPTMWFQKQLSLPARSRGSYLVTDHIMKELPEIRSYKVGLLNLFVQHTSCALSLNENWDEDVRADMSDALDRIAPEAGPKGEALYRHDAEGSDDMPAHIKSALIGASVTIPIKDGKKATGTWQGIWYLEFRASKHQRRVMATIQGEKA